MDHSSGYCSYYEDSTDIETCSTHARSYPTIEFTISTTNCPDQSKEKEFSQGELPCIAFIEMY